MRLLALDLDGTLLCRDGSVDPRDVAAVARARARGLEVTFATGRLTTGALPAARLLGLAAPMVCADGATIASSASGEVLERTPIALELLDRVLACFAEHALEAFVFSHATIHCGPSGVRHEAQVSVWTTDFAVHPELVSAAAFRSGDDVAMVLALGDEASCTETRRALEQRHPSEADPVQFAFRSSGQHAVLVRGRGTNKGVALARVAERLGVAREEVCAVGDWTNDVPMFEWTGRSFAMRGAPEEVTRAATDRLETPIGAGGGVAEAIARLLGD
ncbi:MAG: HAD family phosphatase [Myxococcales bacterium]|nr:HAD family phosphatase [Myxococcales bacterium]